MANEEHRDKLLQAGVDAWNQWRQQNPSIQPDLQGANLFRANLSNANLRRAILSHANLSQANLQQADLSDADLQGANVSRANLFQARLENAQLKELKGAQHTRSLETVLLTQTRDARDFDTCERTWVAKWLGWERFRTVGRLPLFGASYSALILIPIVFFVFALYNSAVKSIRDAIDDITPRLEALIHQDTNDPENPVRKILEQVKSHLEPLKIPSQSLLILISTILLAIGSTLYTFCCPSQIKEFSLDQWRYQMGHSLVHYWALAWKYPAIRFLCAICYTLGGGAALWVILTKVWRAGLFIIRNSALWYASFQ